MKNPERARELIAELKSLADNQFETHRIEVLERDLESPPVVEILDENHQKFDGMTFYKIKNGRYAKNFLLHRYVYIYYYGETPEGYEVHHVDENKANNDIANLQLLTATEHHQIHGSKESSVRKRFDFKCEVCGKIYARTNSGNNRYCSDACKNKAARLRNTIVKNCVVCGNEFESRKYDNVKTCSKECLRKYRSQIHQPTQPKKPKKRVIQKEKRICAFCGKEYETNKYKSAKCCSVSCGNKLDWQKRKNS